MGPGTGTQLGLFNIISPGALIDTPTSRPLIVNAPDYCAFRCFISIAQCTSSEEPDEL